MRWLKSSLLIVILAVSWAETEYKSSSQNVLRVGSRIACQCGCVHTVASCDMFECSFSKPAKEKIGKLLGAGVSDSGIVDQFVKEYGSQIYRAGPNPLGWMVPYITMLVGLAMIFWFVRRYRRKRPVSGIPPVEDFGVARYRDQIEKDLAHLD